MEIIQGIIITLLAILLCLGCWRLKRLNQRCRELEKYAFFYRCSGSIMHDFKNKLSGIIAAADCLSRDLDDADKLQHYVNLIQDACTQTSRLSHNILDFSKTSPSPQDLINVHDNLRQSLYFLKSGLPPAIKLESELKAAHCLVKGNADEFGNIWLNLGFNAGDAMPSGGTLRITTDNVRLSAADLKNMLFSEAKTAGDFLHITISDTGCGIPPSIRPHIFTPFFSTKPQEQGNGLGLAEVARIIQASGGALRLETSPYGTSFHIYIPLSTAPCLPLKSNPDAHKNFPLLQGHKILIIDDDAILQELLTTILQQCGAKVCAASDPASVLSHVPASPLDFDAVILDVVMRSHGGIEAYRQIRPANPLLKIIFTSGSNPDSQLEAILQQDNQTAFLPKPFDKNSVLDKVFELLGKN